jgi:hypothetical protein
MGDSGEGENGVRRDEETARPARPAGPHDLLMATGNKAMENGGRGDRETERRRDGETKRRRDEVLQDL